mmetsp:Transcript_48514/g.62256  ORF Transcript_48514/g.62256 Transcript_48514/m.62256 type:complete len:201 (+) Transcript_48514:927-1529(+)
MIWIDYIVKVMNIVEVDNIMEKVVEKAAEKVKVKVKDIEVDMNRDRGDIVMMIDVKELEVKKWLQCVTLEVDLIIKNIEVMVMMKQGLIIITIVMVVVMVVAKMTIEGHPWEEVNISIMKVPHLIIIEEAPWKEMNSEVNVVGRDMVKGVVMIMDTEEAEIINIHVVSHMLHLLLWVNIVMIMRVVDLVVADLVVKGVTR